MPIILAAITILVQIFFIVHVFRTGRPYWWAFIIFSMPILGSLIYYLVEVFPNSREQRKARKTVGKVVKALSPDADLKRRAEDLEICGSVDNRIALARECSAASMFDEAVKLYDSALTGPYAKDDMMRLELARALFSQGNAARTLQTLHAIRNDAPAFREHEIALLEARALHALGDAPGALGIYERLIPVHVGLEAKMRYALLLKELGHLKQAQSLFGEIVIHGKRFSIKNENETEWLNIARREAAG